MKFEKTNLRTWVPAQSGVGGKWKPVYRVIRKDDVEELRIYADSAYPGEYPTDLVQREWCEEVE